MLLGFRSLAPGDSPALYLPFALTGTLDPSITFSRPSLSTLYDSTGKLTYAPNNLTPHSQNFSGGLWAASNFTRTTGQSDPFGGTSATLGTFTSNGGDGLFQSALNLVADKSYVVSIYAKYGTWRWFEFTTVSGGATRSFVDMENGVAGNTAHSSFLVASVGNGWYRISAKVTGVTEFYWSPRMANGNSGAATTNNGATFYVYGFQAEAVTYQTTPRTYNATTSAVYYGPRFDYDPATLAARGLLVEEARTNLLTYSERFENAAWAKSNCSITTPTAIVAPDGTLTTDKLVEGVGTSRKFMVQIVAFSNATISVYAQQAERSFVTIGTTNGTGLWSVSQFNLSTGAFVGHYQAGGQELQSNPIITNVGNGWYRVSVFSPVNLNQTVIMVSNGGDPIFEGYTGNGVSGIYIWGAQLEAGTFVTSYIPTVASAVARSADSATMTGTNFSSWYNTVEGTFKVSGDTPAIGTRPILSIDNNTAVEQQKIYSFGKDTEYLVVDNSAPVVSIGGNDITADTAAVYTAAYKLNDFAFALNSIDVRTENTGTIPTVNRLRIGADQAGNYLNGHIQSLLYYNTRLSNSQIGTPVVPIPTLVIYDRFNSAVENRAEQYIETRV